MGRRVSVAEAVAEYIDDVLDDGTGWCSWATAGRLIMQSSLAELRPLSAVVDLQLGTNSRIVRATNLPSPVF